MNRDDEIIRQIEQATEAMAEAEVDIKADSEEIKEIRRNNYHKSFRGPGFFSVLVISIKGLFTL